MRKLAIYGPVLLAFVFYALIQLAATSLLPETKRQLLVINDNKGSTDHRGIGAPMIEEFENEVH